MEPGGGTRIRRPRALAAAMAAACAVAACGTGHAVYDLAPPARPGQPAGTVVVAGSTDVAGTVKRVQDAITAAGGTVTATVDHSAQASTVGVTEPANTVVIGGVPAVQWPLLRVDQRAGANLPERYLVRQDPGGGAAVTYDGPDYVAAVAGVGTVAAISALATEVSGVAATAAGATGTPLPAPLLGVTPTGYLITAPGGSFAPTVTRLRTAADRAPSSVVAVVDLSAGSATPGPAVRPTTVVLVSTPEAEAPLIAAAPSFGLEMPMRFVVWLDEQNVTRIGYPDVARMAARHGLPPTDPNVAKLAAQAAGLAKLAAGTAA